MVSIEIVSLFAIPVLAALGLRKLLANKEFLGEKLVIFGKELKWTNDKAVWVAFALTGGVSFLFWLSPTTFFDFFKIGEYDNYLASLKSNGWPAGQIADLMDNIELARVTLFKADALRSFGFILVAAALLWAAMKDKLAKGTVMSVIALLVLVDMWGVNTRYMDVKSGFENKRNVQEPFGMSTADRAILADQSPDKRVLNIATSTFNETGTSYFHHSIGGYNGAKMRNYQEVIENHISREIQQFGGAMQNAKTAGDILPVFKSLNVLNMLNTKYVIYSPEAAPIQNPEAFGGAWFVNKVSYVNSADEEMMALASTDLKNVAIIRNDQKDIVGKAGNGQGSIDLVNYDMDRMTYKSNSSSDQMAVLSEIYYPIGWTATIDGEEVEIGRANYLLRTIPVPAGEHTIEFVFEPSSYYVGENIALAGSVLVILLLAGTVIMWFKNRKETNVG